MSGHSTANPHPETHTYGAACVNGHVVRELESSDGGGYSKCPVCGTIDVMEMWVPEDSITDTGKRTNR